jgi:archaellum biogenesis ATPase FlaH
MQATIQTTVLRNLLNNEDFLRRVIPYIKKEYFEGSERLVFDCVVSFVGKYNKMPTKEALSIEIGNSNISENRLVEVGAVIDEVTRPEPADMDWLLATTEKWCRDRAVFLSIMKSIEIIDGKTDMTENAIPEILQNALSVSFDQNIGHDYINNSDDRFEFYHRQETRLPFDLDYFNKITKGGLPKKTLNIALAGTGVGKSLFMCHVAASSLVQAKNVLYITMEMAEERIAERIDANLMNTPIDQLEHLDKRTFDDKIGKIAKKTVGKLIIKEYPTGSAHAGHFRALLKELELKKNFKPDIIFIDYLNICSSSRMKGLGGAVNTYSLIKSIAEELRGLAVEFNVPIMSATQTTRSGYGSSDVGLEDTSESFGLPATADLMFALISNEELEGLGQIMVKQLKNRYNDPTAYRRFIVGVDRSRMKLYDVEANAQSLIGGASSAPVPQKDKLDFSGFNA